MSDFKTLINSGKPVLVDFYAEWCGPCKAMTPILNDLSTRVGTHAHILKVNVDKNQQAAAAFGIRTVPTLLLFKNGDVVWRHSGIADAAELQQIIQSHL